MVTQTAKLVHDVARFVYSLSAVVDVVIVVIVIVVIVIVIVTVIVLVA